jgi:hypothetical protein
LFLALSTRSNALLWPSARTGYQGSIDRALSYLRDERVSKGIDSLFMLDLLMPGSVRDTDIPKSDAFKRLFDERYKASDISITRLVKDIPGVNDEFIKHDYQLGGYFYEIGGRYSGSVLEGWDDILLKSLYCDLTGFDDVDYAILRKLSDGAGNYFDTHQLLALMFLEGNRCLEPEKIDSLKGRLVENIVGVLRSSHAFIPDRRIDLLITCQRSPGCDSLF